MEPIESVLHIRLRLVRHISCASIAYAFDCHLDVHGN